MTLALEPLYGEIHPFGAARNDHDHGRMTILPPRTLTCGTRGSLGFDFENVRLCRLIG